jgi:hypothetical protein
MRRAYPALLLCLTAAAGCAQFQPYATAPTPKPPTVAETGTRVAMCYNPLLDSMPKVQEAAQKECGANTTAARVDADYMLQQCPTLLPAHATFLCTPNK